MRSNSCGERARKLKRNHDGAAFTFMMTITRMASAGTIINGRNPPLLHTSLLLVRRGRRAIETATDLAPVR